MRLSLQSVLLGGVGVAFALQNLTGVSLPPTLTFLLPEPFEANVTESDIDTVTSNNAVNAILAEARNASYYAYDEEEFMTIVGRSPTVQLIESRSEPFAFETGVWVYDHNQVWFTSSISAPPTYFSILNLGNYTITTPNISISHGPNLNGGYYFNGLQYFTIAGNESLSIVPGIVSVDPNTMLTSRVIDSYFGAKLNSVNDVTWVKPNTSSGATSCTHNETNMFFSSVDFTAYGHPDLSTAELPNAVYRFTPSTNTLQAVISRSDILVPNGVRSDSSGRFLFVTDTAATSYFGPGANSSGSAAIFRFELDADCNPGNKQLFALTRSGISDGIHVDDFGRVWTAESNGIVVRNSRGRELGVFNAAYFLNEETTPIANFALAGDKLVVLAVNRIFVVQLGQNVTTPARYHT